MGGTIQESQTCRCCELYDRGNKNKRVVHVNMLKTFHDRELEVCFLTVIAEDQSLDEDLAG